MIFGYFEENMILSNTCKEVLTRSAVETLKAEKIELRNHWFDEECREVTQEKNKLYKEMIQRHYTRTAVDKYKQARRKEKSMHKKKKREYQEKMLEEIEKLNNQRETQKFYRKSSKQQEAPVSLTNDFKRQNPQISGGSCVGCWQELPESVFPIRSMCEVSSDTPRPLPSPIKEVRGFRTPKLQRPLAPLDYQLFIVSDELWHSCSSPYATISAQQQINYTPHSVKQSALILSL
ncbi:hypothetical protein C0J52_21072 [Blattella germanica]|nr:hypothetical protein C0J52_21072 [Blattella germanica]